MNIEIDKNSGFCFGVVYAIEMAEDELKKSNHLYCLGDIVHNNMEIERLQAKGLEIIDHDQLKKLKDCKVLIRAHGEPPETYRIAIENNITLIDASCPVVLKLQNRIRQDFEEVDENTQLVIYGKEGHAEVNGLKGQTNGKAIVVSGIADLDKINFNNPIHLFSQTTQSTQGFEEITLEIKKRLAEKNKINTTLNFEANDTLCRQVSNRESQLKEFAQKHDVIIFVAGKKSSNGKILFEVCKNQNPNSYFISEKNELLPQWFTQAKSVGICGATSTPMWYMQEVAVAIQGLSVMA